MSFLADYNKLSDDISDPQELAKAQIGLVQLWLSTKTREMFDDLRENDPIFTSPRALIVTKYRDVMEVLHQDKIFSELLYAPRMERISGAFFLGMQNTPQYEREVSIMRFMASRFDLERIRDIVTRSANELVESVKSARRIDVVSQLSRVVPVQFIGDYLGVPGPDDRTMMKWMRALFWDLFANLQNDEDVIRAADEAGALLREYLKQLIADRKAALTGGGAVPDDVLTRLLQLQCAPTNSLDDDGIRRNLTGIMIGAVDTTNECVANILDVLLDRPDQLKEAHDAAAADADDKLSQYLFEALRFKPQHPFLYRICTDDYRLARGTERERMVPQGSFVIAAVWSAMFDADILDNPDQFVPGRPNDNYLLFGAGRHACFGKYINRVQIPAICKSVLRLNDLRRAPGPEGHIQLEGPFPDRFVLEFDGS
ncbi:MAG: cytochrome P450 [Alphaproteobacteria bacterium]|nr:cytochrome P450 [Alphaproteobacteria bacterium]